MKDSAPNLLEQEATRHFQHELQPSQCRRGGLRPFCQSISHTIDPGTSRRFQVIWRSAANVSTVLRNLARAHQMTVAYINTLPDRSQTTTQRKHTQE